ncbi:MAG TPA: DUF2662 domain-containing protein [Actinobacteria bacterium]|nr:DUF2662 domain-containing protein [Actinomycetota bacterium]
MEILKEIEKRLENLFEGFFNTKFRSTLQPVELAHKLTAEMDSKRQVSVSNVYAPNIFTVSLAADDLKEIEGFKEVLMRELSDYLTAHVKEKNYCLAGDFRILLTSDPQLQRGDCRVVGGHEENVADLAANSTQMIPTQEAQAVPKTSPLAFLTNHSLGLEFQLENRVVTIGRRADNDVVLNRPGISRHHARLERDKGAYRLFDLDSTNGTFVNGKEIGQVTLAHGDEVTFGEVNLNFRLED